MSSMYTPTLRQSARRLPALAATGLTAAALTVAASVPAQAATGQDLDARLRATAAQPAAHGHAEYDVDRTGREIEVRVLGLKGLAGQRLTVRVHGDLVGNLTVNRYGSAHLDHETGVPAMSAGQVIKVRTSSGTLVSRGRLHHETSVGDDSDD